MSDITKDFKEFQAELSRFYASIAQKKARRRRLYLKIAGACLLAGGYLIVAYVWGAWQW